MDAVGRIPRATQGLFKAVAGQFSDRAFRHFRGLVPALSGSPPRAPPRFLRQ